MEYAIKILETERKKLETKLKGGVLMRENMIKATAAMANISHIRQAIRLIKAKYQTSLRKVTP